MAALITARCPVCGDQALAPGEVRLVVCSVVAWSYYTFACTMCGDLIKKPANPEIVRLLGVAGVPPEAWVVPAEALEDRSGPALTHDEVLDFLLALDCTDLVAVATMTLQTPHRPD